MNYTWEILKLGTLDQTNSDGDVLADAIISIKWKKIATNDANIKAIFFHLIEMIASANTSQSLFVWSRVPSFSITHV